MKAIFSKKDLENTEDNLIKQFLHCVSDIINLDEIKSLDNFVQHCNTSRLQHSLNVAYYSFLWARKKGLDYKSVARAGLMHDLYLYDWRKAETIEHHAFLHPKVALKTAKTLTNINKIEQDAILTHMWPLCKTLPKYKESYVISLVDKYCTVLELLTQNAKRIKKIAFAFSLNTSK